MRFQAMAVLEDGRIVLGGVVTNVVAGAPRRELAVARLLADGALDPAFGGGDGLLPLGITVSTPTDDRVSGFTILSNGAAMAAVHHGTIPTVNGTVTRLSSSEIFQVAADGSGAVRWAELPAFVKLTRRPDGKFYAWGQTTVSTNGLWPLPGSLSRAYLALLGTDGETEREYRLPGLKLISGGLMEIRDLTVAANGDMLFGVYWSNVKLARVSPEGVVRWITSRTVPALGLIHEEASGHIVGLPYGNWNDGAARFTTDGAETDEGFSSPQIMTWGLCTRLRDGRYVVTGDFATAGGLARQGITCLMEDGSPDMRFVPGTGLAPVNVVTGLGEQPDGKILVAGTFTEFDGQPVSGLMRLLPRNPDAPEHVTAFFTRNSTSAPECGTEVRLKVTRMGDRDGTNSVHAESMSGTAVAGDDFVAISTNLVFAPGVRTADVRIEMVADYEPEGTEQFHINLQSDDAAAPVTTTNSVRLVTIDGDCSAGFATNHVVLRERDARQFEFGGFRDGQLSVNPGNYSRLRFVESPARHGIDYWRRDDVFRIGVQDNATADGERELHLELVPQGPGVRLAGPTNMTVTILDDDDTPAGASRGFGGGGKGAPLLRTVMPYLDRGWMVSGRFESVDGLPRRGLARLLRDGRVDPDFERPPEEGDSPLFAVLADGKLLTAGPVNPDDPTELGVIRLTADGRREAGFALRNPLPLTREAAAPAYVGLDAEGRISVIWTGMDDDFVSRHSPDGELLGLWEPDELGSVRGAATVPEASGSLLLVSSRGVHRLSGASTVRSLNLNGAGPQIAVAVGAQAWIWAQTGGINRYNEAGDLLGTISSAVIGGQTNGLGGIIAMAALSPTRVIVFSEGFSGTTYYNVSTIFDQNGNAVSSHSFPGGHARFYQSSLLRYDGSMRMPAVSPWGEIGILAKPNDSGPNTGWMRLDITGRPVDDVAFDNFVRRPGGGVSATFRGQAPNGLRIEYSDDLQTWTPAVERGDVNWEQSLTLPDDGGERRFYRVRRE